MLKKNLKLFTKTLKPIRLEIIERFGLGQKFSIFFFFYAFLLNVLDLSYNKKFILSMLEHLYKNLKSYKEVYELIKKPTEAKDTTNNF